MNTLYYGDSLDVMRRHLKDESVDLVYLDPTFNSNANYNVLFQEHDGTRPSSQIRLSRTLGTGTKRQWRPAERASNLVAALLMS